MLRSLALSFVTVLILGSSSATAQTETSAFDPSLQSHIVGIRPLTAETLQQAVSWNLQNDSEKNFPHFVQMAVLDRPDRVDERSSLLKKIEVMPFSVQILSPFHRVAFAVSEAKRKFQDLPALSLDEVNAGLVVVKVGPGLNFGTSSIVENVVIKRGDTIHRPVAQNVRATTVANRMGAAQPSAEGDFVFPFEVFSPTAAGNFVLVVIGTAANFEVPMTGAELSRLR